MRSRWREVVARSFSGGPHTAPRGTKFQLFSKFRSRAAASPNSFSSQSEIHDTEGVRRRPPRHLEITSHLAVTGALTQECGALGFRTAGTISGRLGTGVPAARLHGASRVLLKRGAFQFRPIWCGRLLRRILVWGRRKRPARLGHGALVE